MQKLIYKFGYNKTKWGMIALMILLTIIFAISLTLTISGYISYNTYTTITM